MIFNYSFFIPCSVTWTSYVLTYSFSICLFALPNNFTFNFQFSAKRLCHLPSFSSVGVLAGEHHMQDKPWWMLNWAMKTACALILVSECMIRTYYWNRPHGHIKVSGQENDFLKPIKLKSCKVKLRHSFSANFSFTLCWWSYSLNIEFNKLAKKEITLYIMCYKVNFWRFV